MKKIFILFITVILFLNSFVYAESHNYDGNVQLKDYFSSEVNIYKVMRVIVSSDDLITESIPSILYENDGLIGIMVPLEDLVNEIGSDYNFDNYEKEATFEIDSKKVTVKADSNVFSIDGEVYEFRNSLSAKYFGMNKNEKKHYKLMVPIRFLEKLGLEVFWNADTKSVYVNKKRQSMTSIKCDTMAKFQEIRFQLTGDADFSSYSVEGGTVGGKDKIVLEFPNVKFDLDEKLLTHDGTYINDLGGFEISSITALQSEIEPYKVRVDIDLNMKKAYDLKFDKNTNEVVLTLINSVWDIKLEDIYNTKTVVVETGEEPAYNYTPLSDKLIVDVINSKLRMNAGESGILKAHSKEIKTVSYMQFEPSGEYEEDDIITRIVVDLGNGISSNDAYVEAIDDKLYIYVSGNPLDGFKYIKHDIDWASLNLNLNKVSRYTSIYNQSENTLNLIVPQSSIDLDSTTIEVDDNIINEINIDGKSSKYNYSITFRLADGTRFVDNTDSVSSDNIMLRFINDNLTNSIYRGKLIVIDPGHGGKDPGAKGSKITEAKMNLIASKKLKKKLEGVGFNVYMTRDSDRFVGLYNRSDIANDLNADAFISIHSNATLNKAIKGIETLYYPDKEIPKKKLARCIQDKLIEYTGAIDRGIVPRKRLVVTRETKMPSVIVEMGFLTNAEEEQKLLDDSYLDKIIMGIKDGLLKMEE